MYILTERFAFCKKNHPRAMPTGGILGFLDKLFSAFGAGDGDLALSAVDTHRLTALGASEITMLPILDPVDEGQEFAVFLVALIGLSGEAAEQCPNKQGVIDQGEHGADGLIGDEEADEHHDNTGPQDHHIQLIRTVTAGHKTIEPLLDLLHI